MANTLVGGYAPEIYANEALLALEQALGMAGRVFRDIDPFPRSKGEPITIRSPSTFTAQDAPSSAQNAVTTKQSLTLDWFREVKFAVTDRELSVGPDLIVDDHIRPAAYTLAADIDTKLNLLTKDVPWSRDVAASPGVADILAARRVLFDNNVPTTDGRLHMEIDGALEEAFLGLSAFSQNQGAGDTGVSTQRNGTLGNKFGFEVFANQNVRTHTSGTVVSAGTDVVGAVNNAGGYAAGATTMAIDGLSLAETLVEGDSFVIAGNTQRYALTADTTLSSGAGSITFTPGLAAAVVDDTVVTFEDGSGAAIHADSFAANVAFHETAFLLGMAPLSTKGEEYGGVVMSTVADPRTRLSLRFRAWYDADNSQNMFALDVLYGCKTLDPNRACLMRRDV